MKTRIILFYAILLILLSGCFPRKIDLWGAKMEFSEGLDFGVSANAVDHVENTRGIKPYNKQ